MKRSFLLIMFFLIGVSPLRAQDSSSDDQQFLIDLDNIKNPFEDGLPKPVVQPPPQPAPQPVYKPAPAAAPEPVVQPPPEVVVLPDLKLKGIIFGEGIQEAIINDQIVALHGTIEGAEVISMGKEGIEVIYKGKKFFITVD